MKKQTLILITILVLTICFAIGFYVMGWDEPTLPPPDGNISLPLNTGYAGQIKEGGLLIHDSSSFINPAKPYGLIVRYGNVGIGTMAPNSLLRVEGDVAGAKFKDTSNFNYYVDPGNSGTAAAFNGNVGIGTASPSKLLHLKTTSGNAELDIQSGSSSLWGIYQDDATDDLRFWNVDDRMVITNEGRVGIGTAEPRPNARLDINGDNNGESGNGILRLNSRDAGDSTIQLYKARTHTGWAIVYDGTMGTGNFMINRDTIENVRTRTDFEINKNTGKVSIPGGIDPPFVSFSNESHESIREFAKDVVPHEKVMQFWNGDAHRFEIYVIDEDSFYTFAGELIEE